MRCYHVTYAEGVSSILRDGLVPRRGLRSCSLGEGREAVFLFPSLEDVEDALMNWLGEEMDDDKPLALLEVQLPPDLSFRSEVAWEMIVEDLIPPDCIRVLLWDVMEGSGC